MLHAYIDESGQRGLTPKSSDHFVMSAAIVRDKNLFRINEALEQLRKNLNGGDDAYLSWKKLRSHADRLHVSQTLGKAGWIKVSSVISCKRHLPATEMNESQLYLFQFRLLLERLSWIGRTYEAPVSYTLAHIHRFEIAELRHYEEVLQTQKNEIVWEFLDPAGGSIDQPQRMEELQLADLIASATGAAFNEDRFGNTETRYLRELSLRLYRHSRTSPLTSYGLKLHPWNDATKVAYPWIATL